MLSYKSWITLTHRCCRTDYTNRLLPSTLHCNSQNSEPGKTEWKTGVGRRADHTDGRPVNSAALVRSLAWEVALGSPSTPTQRHTGCCADESHTGRVPGCWLDKTVRAGCSYNHRGGPSQYRTTWPSLPITNDSTGTARICLNAYH